MSAPLASIPPPPVADAAPIEDRTDLVSEASMQSFPASDPPPWMSMRVGSPIAHGSAALDGSRRD
jgi:hypothetical protein